MSSQQPVSPGTSAEQSSVADTPEEQAPEQRRDATSDKDPLRGSRTSGIWASVIALGIVLVLTAVFILQNTQETQVNFLGWSGSAPVSAALLIAAAGGALIVAAAGMLRIFQLRHRVKKERKRR